MRSQVPKLQPIKEIVVDALLTFHSLNSDEQSGHYLKAVTHRLFRENDPKILKIPKAHYSFTWPNRDVTTARRYRKKATLKLRNPIKSESVRVHL